MPKPRQNRPKQSIESPETFVFRIDAIDPGYSFGVNQMRREPGGYSEHAHTEIVATSMVPEKQAGRTTTFTLIGDRRITADLEKPMEWDKAPYGIGTLTWRGEESRYLGSLPFDALTHVSALIAADALKFIMLSGPPLKRGTTRINYMSFKATTHLDEY